MDLQQAKRSGSGSMSLRGAAAAGGGGGGGSGATPGLAQLAAPRRREREAKGGCPYLQRKADGGGGGGGGEGALERFKGTVLAAPADVEELARMGRGQQASGAGVAAWALKGAWAPAGG